MLFVDSYRDSYPCHTVRGLSSGRVAALVARVAILSARVCACTWRSIPDAFSRSDAPSLNVETTLYSGTTSRQQPPAVVSVGAYSCLVQDRLHTSPSHCIAPPVFNILDSESLSRGI